MVTYQYLCPAHMNICVHVNKTAHTVLQFNTPALLILRTWGAWGLVSGTRLRQNAFLRIIHCEKHLGHGTHFLQVLCMSKTANWTFQFHRIKIQFKCLTFLLNIWTINWCREAQFGLKTLTRTQTIKRLMLKMQWERFPLNTLLNTCTSVVLKQGRTPGKEFCWDPAQTTWPQNMPKKTFLPSANVSVWHIFWYWHVSVEKWPKNTKDMFSETLSTILGDNKCGDHY